jgi:death-on-curing protein
LKEPVWLSRRVLEAMHTDLILEHGGSAGIRDADLLESALAGPRHKWAYGEGADIPSLAAAYGFGLARNHAFVDGNKRIALMSIYTFLVINRFELNASEQQAVDIMIGVASGSIAEDALAAWIRSNLLP